MTDRVRPRLSPVLVVLASVAFSLSTSRARADENEPKRLVFYVEAVGIDVGVVRARLRDSIPERVIPVDAVDFRAAMTVKGQKGPLRLALATPKERAVLFDRMREVAREMHADGVVFVHVNDAPRKRQAKVVVLYTQEDALALDQVVVLEPATAKSDPIKIKGVLGPVLERFATTPPSAPPAPVPEPPATPEPARPAPPDVVEAPVAPSAPAPAPAPGAPASSRPPISGAVSLELFPAGVAPNYVNARVVLPLSRAVALVGHAGAGYLPLPADDAAQILGGGFRFTLRPGFTIEPSGFYARFPKYVVWYQAALRINAAFGETPNRLPVVRLTLAPSVTRWLWKPDLGAPGAELIEGYAQLELQLRPVQALTIAPLAGYFLYDRSLVGSKPAIGAVTLSLAPYPIQAFFGAAIGYDLGRWTPYLGARYFIYAADIGSGALVGPGLRLATGPDFVDARLGVFVSNTKGPISNRVLETVPMVAVDMGWAF